MRIIAGAYRGRRLRTLRGREVRPTSDRLRETLFDVLGSSVAGSVFVDCYAGSGAVGLEALSRGAAQVFWIEENPPAVRAIENNLAALGGSPQARIVRARASAGLRRLEQQGVQAHFCFLDPPYAALPEAVRSLRWLAASSLMLPGGTIILEHSRKDASPEQIGGWSRTRLLQQGSSSLSFYKLQED
jgi:16S rRNA (guanine(966)-N(2))-methyltransferase RsmD